MAGLVSSDTLEPSEQGSIRITLNPAGKSGDVVKTVTITSNDPDRPEVDVPVTAMVDHALDLAQGVPLEETLFGDPDCKGCHADRAQGLSGIWVYDAVCAMCHGSFQRYVASLEPSLFEREALTTWIADGSGETGMPGYSTSLGGPLSEEQIDTVVEMIVLSRP